LFSPAGSVFIEEEKSTPTPEPNSSDPTIPGKLFRACYKGDVKTIKSLISESSFSEAIDWRDEYGRGGMGFK
jgi:hypothetical protein